MANRLPVSLDPVASMSWAPSGPGVFGYNLIDTSPDGIEAVFIDGDQSRGIAAGMLTGAPEINKDPDTQNYLDNVVGLSAEYKGAMQPGTISVEASAEVGELSHDTIMKLQPGLSREDWNSDAHATLLRNPGVPHGAFAVTARTPGVAGNSVDLAITVPDGAGANPNGPVVTVGAGDVITVDVETAAAGVPASTAREVVNAINAHPQANILVQAGLYGAGNRGTGIVAAAASAPLAGGAAGSRVGYRYSDTGFFSDEDYLDNVVMVLPTTFQNVYYVCVVKNAINVAEWNPSYDENGAVAGVEVTWRGHVTAADRNGVTGAMRGALDQYLMDASIEA